MTISSSLNAGIAGLTSNASRLSSISDNIANSSTFGYKRVETDFFSMVNSTNGGTYTAGGVRTTTQRLIDEVGSIVSTSNATDLAVPGRGFLPVASAAEVANDNGQLQMLLTTTGSFRQDSEGYLSTESGLVLMGWPANANGTIPNFTRDTSDALEPIQILTNDFSSDPTTSVSLGVNLPAAQTESTGDGEPENLSIEYFDNLGTSQKLQIVFTPNVPATGMSNEWTMSVQDSASNDAVVGEYTLTFDDSRTGGGKLSGVTTVSGGGYDATTGTTVVTVAGGPIEIDIGTIGDDAGITQLSDTFAPVVISKDGTPIGSMVGVEVDQNGLVRASFDTGVTKVLYKVPLVDMPNPNGMIAMSNQTYMPSPESGNLFLWDASDGPTDVILSYAREVSATDVAGELTAMIQTQRAYSSNAKIIQTVDEMMQETTNIKR
ncbi:MAG: flagellar hook protein FlgE [Arenibacterium sp.]